MFKRVFILILVLSVVLVLGVSIYDNSDELVNFDCKILASNCHNCNFQSHYSANNDPTIINLKTGTCEQLSVEGYAHTHAAVKLENNDFLYVVVDYSGRYWLLRCSDKKVVSQISIKNIPNEVYAYMDTVLLCYSDGDLSSLYTVDFNNKTEQLLIQNIATLQYKSVFVSDNKLLYRSYSENNNTIWNIYENGTTSTFTHEGLCVGFVENSVLFYKKISNSFILNDLSSLYEIGKFEKYDIVKDASEFIRFSILYGTVVENFTVLDDEHIVVYSYNEKSGGQKHTILNLKTGERQKLGLKSGYYRIQGTVE